MICEKCGSNELLKEGGFYVCPHCGTRFSISADERTVDGHIELNEDVARLLRKCEENPQRAVKYAQLILEMDPYNEKAKSILAAHRSNTGSSSSGCYVATAVYGSYDCPQVWTLRRYRDNTLAKTWYGRAFIRTYYAISPTLVKWFGHTVWFKKLWKGKLDRMVNNLNKEGVKDTPYQDKSW